LNSSLLFKNYTVVVTGASRNLGADIATTFGKMGVNVIACGKSSTTGLTETVKKIRMSGGIAIEAVGDVGDPTFSDHVASIAQEHFGRVDCLVTAAAIRPRVSIADLSTRDWDDVIRTNLSSCFYLTKALLPSMVSNGFGRVIFIGGVDGHVGSRNRVHNVTAKAGLTGLAKAIAMEYGQGGITANIVSPGTMNTVRDLADYPWWPPKQSLIDATIPVGRLGEPHEVTSAVLFLASENSSYVTGQVLHVNGGKHMP